MQFHSSSSCCVLCSSPSASDRCFMSFTSWTCYCSTCTYQWFNAQHQMERGRCWREHSRQKILYIIHNTASQTEQLPFWLSKTQNINVESLNYVSFYRGIKVIAKKVSLNRKTEKWDSKTQDTFHLQGRVYINCLEKSSSPYQDYNKEPDFTGPHKSDGHFPTLYLRHT